MNAFNETFAGQIIYRLSGRKVLRYREEEPAFTVPARYYEGLKDDNATASAAESGEKPSQPSRPPPQTAPSGLSARSGDTRYFTPREERQTAFETSSSHSDTTVAGDGQKGPSSPNEEKDVEKTKTEQEAAAKKGKRDPNLVTWYGPNDPDNPRNWTIQKKCFVTMNLCILTFSIYMGSSIVTPSLMELSSYFQISTVVATLSLTLFVVGYGVGPMVLAPLSEIPAIGRNAPYIITLAIFVGLQPAVATAKTPATYMVLRFLSGVFGSPALATGGASVGDLFEPKKRAYAMGVWGLSAVCGPTLGPLIGGFAYDGLGWRWTIWPLAILSGASLVWLTFFLQETSSSNILYRRAQRLRERTGNMKLYSEGEVMMANMNGGEILQMTLIRPFRLQFEPIVGLLNLHIAFVYSILYTWLEAFPLVFQETYGFNSGEMGLAFLGLFVGSIITYLGFCIYSRMHLEPLFDKKGGMVDPEDRLIVAMFGCGFIPICLFGFGWTSTASIHWIVPIVLSSLFGVGTFLLFQAILNYEADAYPQYAASVLASNDLFRSIMGAAFPLFARQMFENLQKVNGPNAFPVAWGSTLLGCIGLLLCPLPFVFYKYGARIRKYSKFATSEKPVEDQEFEDE